MSALLALAAIVTAPARGSVSARLPSWAALAGSKAAKSAPMVVVQVAVGEDPYGRLGSTWPSPGALNREALLQPILRAADQYPRASILVRLFICEPRWWLSANPTAAICGEDGKPLLVPIRRAKRRFATFCSDVWLDAMQNALAAAIREIERSPASPRVIAYELCGGKWDNWSWWPAGTQAWFDYSEAAREAFRRWLRKAYGSLPALRVHWGQPARPASNIPPEPGETFKPILGWADADIPSPSLRQRCPLSLLEPPAFQPVADLRTFLSFAAARAASMLARTCKSEAPKKLCGVRYGYLPEAVPWPCDAGQTALGWLLRQPHIDFVSGPSPSQDADSCWPQPWASIAARGKLWVADLCANAYPAALALAACIVADRTRPQPPAQWRGSQRVAMLFDERSADFFNRGSPLPRLVLADQLAELLRSDMRVELWLLDDIARVPQDRILLVPNAYCLRLAQRQALRQRLEAGGRVAFLYAPGALGPATGFNGRRMKQTTGIALIMTRPRSGRFTLELSSGASLAGHSIQPWIASVDPEADVVGQLQPGQWPGAAVKNVGRGTALWAMIGPLPAKALRTLLARGIR